MVDTPELEDQDQAEVLDETNLTRDGEDIANFDEILDVFDVTEAIGDAGEDEEADDGIETEEDVDEEHDARISPHTRLEDRPETEGIVRGRLRRTPEDQIIDDEEDDPAGFEDDDDS
ncbi:MAG TPA: primosomal protein [Caulobacteraceae bacterium]|jgi:hypothetical protein|nr:primosomal protein [Caulobacteraceae bacterium]